MYFSFKLFLLIISTILVELSVSDDVPNGEHVRELSFIGELNRNFTAFSCGRIVYGEPVTFGQKPFQIALFWQQKFICGGSLIGRKHVLTAAHCVVGKKARDLKIHYGTIKYAMGIPNFVERVKVHPEYRDNAQFHDIAVLRLRNVVRPFGNVSYVPMNSKLNAISSSVFGKLGTGNAKDTNNNNTIVQVSGWGRVGPYRPVSEQLLVTNLTLVDLQECSNRWKEEKFKITQGMICAMDSGSKSACRGDSGGPLTMAINDIEMLIGVVSVGAATCQSADLPNIFTDVSHYRDWIYSLLN